VADWKEVVVRFAFDTAIAHEHRRYLSSPACPNCGALVAAAEASEYMSDGRICHRWLCEDCDTDFRTVIRIAS
jgi:hypothetical protein